ncbi:DNA-processing protein DprA [Candidatus Saccharibacteria bacterium]|nr:DNA-processing protein DprA [Candidatus Saccharibacteria bacterium]
MAVDMEIKGILPHNSKYLKRLDYLKKPPERIYFYGCLPEFSGDLPINPRFPKEGTGRPRTVAIVGSRKMTAYGESWAFKIAKELAELGVIIVSGMAIGIDSAAHRGALSGGGRTIAVLGTPINRIYPPENKKLFEEIIAQNGCVMSEVKPGVKMGPELRTNAFLERNRLIAGLSDVVIVVEADERSGSLNTASHALEQGVPLFAIPGDLSRQMSRGCNRLFNKGASAFTDVSDIVSALFPGRTTKKRVKMETISGSADEKAVVSAILDGLTSGEEILSEICKNEPDFDVSRFNIAITTLELKGVVKRELGNQWILV